MNLIDTGLTLYLASALTEASMNANLMDFFTGRMNGVYKVGSDGSYRLTLPEIMQGANIAKGHGGVMDVITKNLKDNGWELATQMIVAPMVVKVGKKLLRKPILTPVNRLLKDTGLAVSV